MSLARVISATWESGREICGKCPFRHHPKIDLARLAAYRKPKRRSGQSSWAVKLFEISLLADFVGEARNSRARIRFRQPIGKYENGQYVVGKESRTQDDP